MKSKTTPQTAPKKAPVARFCTTTKKDCLKVMQTFSASDFPTLDVAVVAALELFIQKGMITFTLPKFKRALFVGSGNAIVTGQIIAHLSKLDAVFADEGSYNSVLETAKGVDGAILVSASGSKHAISIAKDLQQRKLPTALFTTNPDAPAMDIVGAKRTHIFPRNREPYTYNTSTYMGMILAASKEDPKKILAFITKYVEPLFSQIQKKSAYVLLVEPRFDLVRPLLYTKFDELFGGEITGRIFTTEQTKHAKTVVKSKDEFFISFGFANKFYGYAQNRLTVPLPKWADLGAVMAISYFVVGMIQTKQDAYFAQNIVSYCKDASKIFKQDLKPIVE